jgi:uncharacterized protein (UPF0218 family)
MKLTPRLRDLLKKPLGEVVSDAASIPKGAEIIAIGDSASEAIIAANLNPLLVVPQEQDFM